MKIFKILSGGALLLLFVSSGIADAKMIRGKVASVDELTRKLSVSATDDTGQASVLDIWVNGNAAMAGITALADLKEGDTVLVEAAQDSEGNWKASQVTKS